MSKEVRKYCRYDIHAWVVAKITVGWLYRECDWCGTRQIKMMAMGVELADEDWVDRINHKKKGEGRRVTRVCHVCVP